MSVVKLEHFKISNKNRLLEHHHADINVAVLETRLMWASSQAHHPKEIIIRNWLFG